MSTWVHGGRCNDQKEGWCLFRVFNLLMAIIMPLIPDVLLFFRVLKDPPARLDPPEHGGWL